MTEPTKRLRRRPLTLIAVVAALVLVAGLATIAQAADPTKVPTFTGCLAAEGGTIYAVADGQAPAKQCIAGDREISLSSGDITAIAAGQGLAGGATEGDATLQIAPEFQLPQQCDGGAVPKWDPNTDGWICASDLDTSLGQVNHVWASPHWQTHWRGDGGSRPRFTTPDQEAHVWVLNLNYDVETEGVIDVSVWWFDDSGRFLQRDNLELLGGARAAVHAPTERDDELRSGWVVVVASEPVLVGGRQLLGDGVTHYQMPFFPLDCTDPAHIEWACHGPVEL